MTPESFPGSSVVNPSDNAGDASLILALGKCTREGNDNPLQYSCLGKSMDRGSWRATVHGVAKLGHSLVTKQQQKWYPSSILHRREVKVTQSCPTLCDPVDCSLPGSFVHGILQVRILKWVVTPFSRGSSQHRDRTQISHIAGGFFTIWATKHI